jgi:hypothetical protein
MKKYLALVLSLSAMLTLSACGNQEKDKVLEIKDFTTVMKTGDELIDPVHGKEVNFLYGALSGQNGTNANGVGYVHTFADGFSVITGNLNIELAEKGKKYTAFIEGESGAPSIALGAMESIIGDVRHSVKFETSQTLPSTVKIVVYREGSGEKNVVATGDLQPPSQPAGR